jgi:hypothetical protein
LIGGCDDVPRSARAAHQRQVIQPPAGAEKNDHLTGMESPCMSAGPAGGQQQGAKPEQIADRADIRKPATKASFPPVC